ncbi:MAG TPA: NAD(P)-binding domain-containing protein [Acidimicrobiales bacterium]|nr:NAD(P)-binding domain-containing protein [Acidimicrobiales bacterium]
MKIGIIGAGNIGGNLTRRFTTLGHDVSVANSRGPETLAELVKETGATAVLATEAAQGAEVVVITIPEKNIPGLPAGILDGMAADAVVIDTGNYYPQQRDGKIEEIENGTPESRWVANRLGHPVVKAFNGIYASHLLTHGKPAGSRGRLALPVAGDDPAAKAIVVGLLDQLGFDGVDAGGLDDSWRQQPGTPVYGADLNADGVRQALADARPERPTEFRG